MKNELFSLKGRVAVVTGSSRGLGYMFAKALCDAGAIVAINGRNAEALNEAHSKLTALGYTTHPFPFDATEETAVEKAFDKIESTVGPIEILVNNAGIQHRAPLEDFPLDEWERLVKTNLTGPFLVARAAARRMLARGKGKIINIASLQSSLGRKTIAPYAATKGGLAMLTRAMTVEWASRGLQINAIGPGYFLTEMTQVLADDPQFDSWLKARTPANRWGNPEELIGALLLFASSASNFINGQMLYVDGGITAAI